MAQRADGAERTERVSLGGGRAKPTAAAWRAGDQDAAAKERLLSGV